MVCAPVRSIISPYRRATHALSPTCQYKPNKDDKSNFVFKGMLFAKFTQAHATFSRGICHLL